MRMLVLLAAVGLLACETTTERCPQTYDAAVCQRDHGYGLQSPQGLCADIVAAVCERTAKCFDADYPTALCLEQGLVLCAHVSIAQDHTQVYELCIPDILSSSCDDVAEKTPASCGGIFKFDRKEK